MSFSFFLTFRKRDGGHAALSTPEIDTMVDILRATPKLRRALVFTPERASDPYLNDGPPPDLACQLYFAELPELEAALARGGALQALASGRALQSLEDMDATQQAMLVRSFPCPDSTPRNTPGEPYCTYLVAYEGEAEDLNLWHAFYLAHHPKTMARMPGIRAGEIYTCVDWIGQLPFRRVDYMQRNKVVFDSSAALTAALNSPVRREMRAEYQHFPKFSGPNTHYPMATREIDLCS